MNASQDQPGSTVFRQGARDVAPTLLGVIPFGIVAGIASSEAGLNQIQILALSAGVFGGAAQLAAVTLLGAESVAAVAILTGLVINARYVMYSASISPYLSEEPMWKRISTAHLLVDQVYAICVARYRRNETDSHRIAYFFGAGVTIYFPWVLSNLVGDTAVAYIPQYLSLEFAVPMTFLALLVLAIRDSAGAIAALASGLLATVMFDLPANLGMPIGAVGGVIAALVYLGLTRK